MISGRSLSSVGIASSPFPSGMTTSIRITSGFKVRASKIASRPEPASPTGSMSALLLEQQADPGADDCVVVDDQHPGR